MSKIAGEFITENLSQLRPVKFLDQVSVMVLTMMMFLDEMKLRHRGCLCQESSNLKLTKTLCLATCPKKTFDMFSISACHLHPLTQLERTEILQTLTNFSIYNAYCAHGNFLWWFPYKLSEKAEMVKDKGINLSVILSNQAPGVLMISPGVLMVSLQCTEHPRCTHDNPHASWCPQCTHDNPPVY